MHGRSRNEDDPMAEMNFIPLIDIALTLVIILMVTTIFIKHPGVSLKLPETRTQEGAPETNKDLTIVIAENGKIYVDAKERAPAELQAHLNAVAKKNKDSRILVKGDHRVKYGRVMDVMDMVRQAGLTKVVLPTDPKLPVPPPTSTPAPSASQPKRSPSTVASR